MSETVGQIGLDLVANTRGFEQQISHMASFARDSIDENFDILGDRAGKLGELVASAFAFDKLKDFTASCLDLGSDLAEVQNVVDVTFTSMSDSVNSFAKNAMAQFGLSETVAKQYMGTFGAMSKAFGFSEQQAYSMAEAVTGLTADVASFYNLDYDEAYIKMKSIWTGETESLKDLGVVMTQTALDQYALANGYGKTTNSMSEQEKVALRYKFVLEQLSLANGDFSRTSDGWANSTRVLALRFDALKATLGQGFINLFTPIVQCLNTLIDRLQVFAQAFSDVTAKIMGVQQNEASGIGQIATDFSNATSESDGLGESAEKTGKKLKKALMGFDEINKLDTGKEDTDGNINFGLPEVSTGNAKSEVSALSDLIKSKLGLLKSGIDKVVRRFKELAKLFKSGFNLGVNWSGIEEKTKSIKNSLGLLKDSLIDIFIDKSVLSASSKWADNFIFNLGKVAGSVTSIVLTLEQLLIGGISKAVSDSKDDIKRWIISMFDIGGDIQDIIGDFSIAFADIFSVFGDNDSQKILSDVLTSVFTTAGGVLELAGKLGRDILNEITKPWTDNKDKVKTALESALGSVSKVTGGISEFIKDIWKKIQEVYDTYIKPALDTVAQGFSDSFGKLLDVYNDHIAPAIDRIADKLRTFLTEHLKPLFEFVVEFFGKLTELLVAFYEEYLKPKIDLLVSVFLPIITDVIETIVKVVIDVADILADVIAGIVEVINGIIDFLTGVFKGDWEKAWEGIKEIFKGVWYAIKGIVMGVADALTDIVEGVILLIVDTLTPVFNWLADIWTDIKRAWADMVDWTEIHIVTPLFDFFVGLWNGIKNTFSQVGSWFSEKFNSAVTGIKDAFGTLKDFFGNVYQGIKDVFSGIPDWFKAKFSDAWQNVKDVFSSGGQVFSGIKEGIAETFRSIVNSLIDGINVVISMPFDKINEMLNSIKYMEILGHYPFYDLWGDYPLQVPQIPKLAKGGLAYQPTLAMIGDNRNARTDPEVVAPLSKLQGMMGNSDNTQVLLLLTEILNALNNQKSEITLDNRIFGELVRRTQTTQNKRSGGLA